MIRLFSGILLLLGAFIVPSSAATLSESQIKRVEEAKSLLSDVNTEPLKDTIAWLSDQRYPDIHIQMEEAVAQTYAKLAKEHQLKTSKDKKWLYSQIKLNLAYLQFIGAEEHVAGNDDGVNKLIQRTLKDYLSPEVLQHPDFVKSVE